LRDLGLASLVVVDFREKRRSRALENVRSATRRVDVPLPTRQAHRRFSYMVLPGRRRRSNRLLRGPCATMVGPGESSSSANICLRVQLLDNWKVGRSFLRAIRARHAPSWAGNVLGIRDAAILPGSSLSSRRPCRMRCSIATAPNGSRTWLTSSPLVASPHQLYHQRRRRRVSATSALPKEPVLPSFPGCRRNSHVRRTPWIGPCCRWPARQDRTGGKRRAASLGTVALILRMIPATSEFQCACARRLAQDCPF